MVWTFNLLINLYFFIKYESTTFIKSVIRIDKGHLGYILTKSKKGEKSTTQKTILSFTLRSFLHSFQIDTSITCNQMNYEYINCHLTLRSLVSGITSALPV